MRCWSRIGLNAAFVAACQRRLPKASAAELNWTMLNLRKAGRLGGEVTRQRRARHDEYRHAAEIAARAMEDRYGENIDRVLCDPDRKQQFDKLARQLAPHTTVYWLRKAALGLRKARQLRPELVVRVADWGRVVESYRLDVVRGDPTCIPRRPGVYLFLDPTGYLYIGEAGDLRDRVQTHVEHSDRPTLAAYLERAGVNTDEIMIELHVFDPQSAAVKTSMRRAYESELIASRQPRFNVRP